MKILFILLIFQILINKIKLDIIEKCEVGNYCGPIPCSVHGYCDFNISNYYRDFMIGRNHKIECKCNMGYSSYDIEKLEMKDRTIYCCYKKKSHLVAILLQIFIGFGSGQFYIGNIKIGLIVFFIELFLCTFCICMMYFNCKKEHTIIINLDEIGKKENNEENKNREYNEVKEIDEDENILNENKMEKISENNESKNQSIDEEENKINELLSDDIIKCPKTKFFIFFSCITLFIFLMVDISLMGFGRYKDINGEELNMWY